MRREDNLGFLACSRVDKWDRNAVLQFSFGHCRSKKPAQLVGRCAIGVRWKFGPEFPGQIGVDGHVCLRLLHLWLYRWVQMFVIATLLNEIFETSKGFIYAESRRERQFF